MPSSSLHAVNNNSLDSKAENDFEKFKSNLRILENRFNSTQDEFLADVQSTKSWIEYIKSNKNASRDEIAHFLEVSLPKIIEGLLNNTKKMNSEYFNTSVSLLKATLQLCSLFVSNNIESLNKMLLSIFTFSKPIYRNSQIETTKLVSASLNSELIQLLTVGYCVDCYSKQGKWDVVIISRISDDKKEIEVTWPNETLEVISLNNEPKRIAFFGSKTKLNKENNKNLKNDPVLVSENEIWRKSLKVGDIIDVQNQQNIWYQACIIDISSHQAQDASEVSSLENKYQNLSEHPKAPSSRDLVESIYEDSSNPVDAANNSRPLSLKIDTSTSTNNSTGKVFVKVAYIAMAETNDEWINILDNRIQKVNQFSLGKIGERLPIRDEILNIVKVHPDKIGEDKTFAVLRTGLFFSNTFVDLIEEFARLDGFQKIFHLLSVHAGDQQFSNQAVPQNSASLFPLIILIGNISKSFSYKTLTQFGASLVHNIKRIILKMEMVDIRETNTEMVEKMLSAVEQLSILFYGENMDSAEKYEPLQLDVSIRSLLSPFLNRRLGGLKMLNNLIFRAQLSIDDSSSQIDISSFPGMKPNTLVVPLDNVPVVHSSTLKNPSGLRKLYFLTPFSICEALINNNIVANIFGSNSIHISIIERSQPILAFLAKHESLNENALAFILTSGLERKIDAAFDCVSGLVQHLHTSQLLISIIEFIIEIDATQFTPSIINLLFSVSLKCRYNISMEGIRFLNFSEFEKLHSHSPSHSKLKLRVLMEEQEVQGLLMLNNQIFSLFWKVLQSSSNQNAALSQLCLSSIEKLTQGGLFTNPELSFYNISFIPWILHWERMKILIDTSIDSIRKSVSLVESLKLLKICIFSWNANDVNLKLSDTASQSLESHIPFTPHQQAFVEYLSTSYALLDILTNAVVFEKNHFDLSVKKLLTEKKVSDFPDRILDDSVQDDLNDIDSTSSSKKKYLEVLSFSLEFLQVFTALSPKVVVPMTTFQSIWSSIVLLPKTTKEYDAVITFFMDLPVKLSSGIENNQSNVSSLFNSIYSVYSKLFHEEKFLMSPYFGIKSLHCIQNWFEWIVKSNLSNQYLSSSSPIKFSLNSIEIFYYIECNCAQEDVAKHTVEYLTQLPEKLPEFIEAVGGPMVHRKSLIERALSELKSTARSDHKKMSRILLLFEGCIDNIVLKFNDQIIPHGVIGSVNFVQFTLRSTSQSLLNQEKSIELSLYDTVLDLYRSAANALSIRPNDIKLFFNGLELSMDDHHKSLSQIEKIKDKNSLFITLRSPKHTIKHIPSHRNSTHTNRVNTSFSKSTHHMNRNPVIELSVNKEFFDLAFAIMSESKSEICDKFWHLLSKIPTFSSLLKQWVELECEDVHEYLNLDNRLNELPFLLYCLKLILVLLQPTDSVEEFSGLENYAGNLNKEQLISWPERFVQKHGFFSISYSFNFVQSALSKYVKSSVEESVGITPGLLQESVIVTTKLMRAFLIRMIPRKKLNHMVTLPQFNPQSCGLNYSIPKQYFSDHVSSLNQSIEGLNEIDKPVEILKLEWGWQIELFNRIETTEEVELADLFLIFWNLLVNWRSFCDIQYNIARIHGKNLKFDAKMIQASQILLHNSLVSLFCLILRQPSLLLNLSVRKPIQRNAFDFRLIIQNLILGNWSSATSISNEYKGLSDMGILFSAWFTETIKSLADWTNSSKFDSNQNKSLDYNLSNHLHVLFITNLVAYRPVLSKTECVYISKSTLSPKQEELQNSFKPFFYLLNTMLESCDTDLFRSVIPFNLRSQAVQDILEDFQSLLQALSSESNDPLRENYSLLHMAGTSSLFKALILTDASLMASCSNKKFFDFLTIEVLGIEPVRQSLTPILCKDKESRSNFYDILSKILLNEPNLSMRIYQPLSEAHSSTNPPSVWEYKPETESISRTGFVGLRNMGSTCYMNSLLQVLFMNQDIRNFMLNLDFYENFTEEELKDDIVYQLRNIFVHLKYSKKKYFTPEDWMQAFKDETGINPVDVMLQQDAMEFFQQLCARFEQKIGYYRSFFKEKLGSIDLAPTDIFKKTFGGKICNQMYRTSARKAATLVSTMPSKEIREQYEDFFCISLGVKGHSSLFDSLNHFVAEEQISDYIWEDQSPPEVITKRQCLSEMSKTLIFHLKRFELNFETFGKEKVNDVFSFPTLINMFPFSKEGIDSKQDTIPSSNLLDFEYELVGVVVHTGSTDSGHYYCFLKDTEAGTDSSHWIEFNDSEVSQFSESLIEQECFGGKSFVHEFIPSVDQYVTTETMSQKNAYMLIYNHVESPSTSSKLLTRRSSSKLFLPMTKRSLTLKSEDSHKLKHLITKIELDNSQLTISQRILSREHLSFFLDLIKLIENNSTRQNNTISTKMMFQVYLFSLKYVAHTSYKDIIKSYFELLNYFINLNLKNDSFVTRPNDSEDVLHYASGPSTNSLASPSAVVLTEKDQDKENHLPASSQKPNDPSFDEEDSGDLDSPFSNIQKLKKKRIENYLKMTPERSLSNISMPIPHDSLVHGTALSPTVSRLPSNSTESTREYSDLTLAQVVLEESMKNFSLFDSYIQSPLIDVRQQFSGLFSNIILQLTQSDSREAIFNETLLIKEGSFSSTFVVGNETTTTGSMEYDEDAELALAIQMSKEQPAINESVAQKERLPQENPSQFSKDVFAAFLMKITSDQYIQSITENWRRVDGLSLVLYSIASDRPLVVEFLIKRDFISLIIDLILGEQSPLCGQNYSKGTRVRAPSSYVLVTHPNPKSPSSYVAQTRGIPDWTHFLNLLALLVEGGRGDPSMIQTNFSFAENLCLKNKTLYSTLIRQYRYIDPFIVLAKKIGREDVQVTNMLCEVIFEELSLATPESLCNLFLALEGFLSIPDSLLQLRVNNLFLSGSSNLIQLMSSFKDQPNRHLTVCVFIRSFISLLQNIPQLLEALSIPTQRSTQWAPWMIAFSYKFVNKILSENQEVIDLTKAQALSSTPIKKSSPHNSLNQPSNQAVQSTSSSFKDSTKRKGPYLYVYGEEDSVRECTWQERAEQTFESLYTLTLSMGLNPDSLIPENPNFTSPTPAVDAIQTLQGPDLPSSHVLDAMTDEELARYLNKGGL